MIYTKSGDTFIVRIDRGEEVVSCLKVLCRKEGIRCGIISALGATDCMSISIYDTDNKVFCKQTIEKPMEITMLHGNVSTMDGDVYLHLHITTADVEGHAFGGHLNECRISATCELFIQSIDANVDRKKDEVTGLNLFEF